MPTAHDLFGPAALARQDAALVQRLREERGLGAIALSAALAIALGAGAYGAVFGLWRAPEMGLYVALKLPLLFFAIAACTTPITMMLAALTGSRLSFRQSAVLVLLALAVTSVVLGALAPIALLAVLTAPPPDPIALQDLTHPRALASLELARTLLLSHVAVIGAAGAVGVVRVRHVLASLVRDPLLVRRVLVGWLATELAVGAELSWLMRPFFGKPHLPAALFRVEALEGNFLEELTTLASASLGPTGSALALAALLVATAWLARSLATEAPFTELEVLEAGVRARGELVRWSALVRLVQIGRSLRLELLTDDGSLRARTWTVTLPSLAAAGALARTIEQARASALAGPFRGATRADAVSAP